MPQDEFIIKTYLMVDALYNQLVQKPLRRGGFAPKLSDCELICMEIVGEFLGMDTDKKIWQYFKQHWQNWFPNLGSYPNFAKQCANLYWVKQQMHQKITANWCEQTEYYADAFPIAVCKFARAKRHQNFRAYATFGYCASKKETYYGFKGHLLITRSGMIKAFTFTAANVDERQVLPELLEGKTGFVGADKGYLSSELKDEMKQSHINLQTPYRSNMKDDRSPQFLKWLKNSRRMIETVIGQLTERFNMEIVHAKNLFHQSNRFIRKILSHNFCCLLNQQIQHPITQFAGLIWC